MNNIKWKPVLIAAAGLTAAAFSVFGGSAGSVSADKLQMITGETSVSGDSSGQADPGGTDSTQGSPETGQTENSVQEGFNDLQKQELEELVGRIFEQQLSAAVSAAVTDSLDQNLNSMMEDGRLPRGIAQYQEVQSGLVNINTADENELTALNGIGKARAQAICKYREEHGAFSSIDDLVNVSGISSGIVEKLRDQATL